MPDALAYLISWTTYGTWLPGDERGWVETGKGVQPPDARRQEEAESLMTEDICVLTMRQRRLVEKTIADHCEIRGWELHTVNCRTNHVHVVVTADREPDIVRDQFKAWCTRRLKEWEQEHDSGARPRGLVRLKWWTEGGSARFINDEAGLEEAIKYVRDQQ